MLTCRTKQEDWWLLQVVINGISDMGMCFSEGIKDQLILLTKLDVDVVIQQSKGGAA